MDLFHIPSGDRELLACYHAPAKGRVTHWGLVICYPICGEYIQIHRSLFKLSTVLAAGGYPTLRFDYSGCGDSSGGLEEAKVSDWLADVSAAIDWLREHTGAEETCLIGCRFGATLAALVADERKDVGALTLWDPILRGKDLLGRWVRMQQDQFGRGSHRPGRGGLKELLGFPITDALFREIEGIDLMAAHEYPAGGVFLLVPSPDDFMSEFLRRASSAGVDIHYEEVAHPRGWMEVREGMYDPVFPAQALQRISSWISRSLH